MKTVSSNLTVVLTFSVALLFFNESSPAQIIFDNGDVNVVDSLLADYIVVQDSVAGAATTVTVEDGADIPSFDPENEDTSIMVSGSSIVEISGGVTAGGFNLLGNSMGIFSAGVVGDEVQTFDNTFLTIGTPDGNAAVLDIQDDLEVGGNSIVDMYDGRVFDDVETSNSAVLNLFGGEYDEDIEAFDNSVINIFGGIYSTGFGDLDDIEGGEIAVEDDEVVNSAQINIHGGFFMGALFDPDFCAQGNGTMMIFGSDFAVDGVEVEFGPIEAESGLLTGILEDGSELNNDFIQLDNGVIILVEVGGLVGDVNCDGVIDLLDVSPFVEAVSGGSFNSKADINMDGVVDLLDVGPFVALLSGN